MNGWLVPPISGEYEFFIASGGYGELWLSLDDHPANMEVKCFQPLYKGVGNGNSWIGLSRNQNQFCLRMGVLIIMR
jgi:hypothetical protein